MMINLQTTAELSTMSKIYSMPSRSEIGRRRFSAPHGNYQHLIPHFEGVNRVEMELETAGPFKMEIYSNMKKNAASVTVSRDNSHAGWHTFDWNGGEINGEPNPCRLRFVSTSGKTLIIKSGNVYYKSSAYADMRDW